MSSSQASSETISFHSVAIALVIKLYIKSEESYVSFSYFLSNLHSLVSLMKRSLLIPEGTEESEYWDTVAYKTFFII